MDYHEDTDVFEGATRITANYCLQCGHALEDRRIGDVMRRACPQCSFVFWGDYSLGVGALVIREGKILLVRRAEDPGKGVWTNPGGYAEQLEPLHDTVVREVLEETGVQASVSRVVALRDQPRGIHNLYIAYQMQYEGGDPIPDMKEVDAAGFFALDELDGMNVAGLTRWLIEIALNGRQEGLVYDAAPIVPLNDYGLFRVRYHRDA